jgi:hypothetical protein
MKILPLSSITPIIPVVPINNRKKTSRKQKVKTLNPITDENLGENIDITIEGPLNAPNCHDCISYDVTWDSDFPHGCKMFEFKRRDGLPSLSVYKATGCHCLFFKKNTKIKN